MRRIHASSTNTGTIDEIVSLLRDGGVACLPTDTLYGLAVDAFNAAAAERLYELKGRPGTMPLILLVDSLEMAREVSLPPTGFDDIASRFWPGPVTFVMNSRPALPERITGHSGSIALRWPASELVVRVVRELGRPITSTSANRSGNPPALSGEAAARELPNIDLLVDSGPTPVDKPSTLVDLTSEPPVLLREGRVSWADLSEFFDGHIKRRSA